MLAALAFAPLAIARTQAAAKPVSEVVDMLKEMQTTLEKEQKADEDMYAELRGWCKENNDVKSVEVSDGQARIQELTGLAAEANASAQSLATEMSALATEVSDATAALDAARVLHGNKVDTFNDNEKSLYKDIEAVEAASTAISGGVPALMQIPEGRLKEMSAKLQDAVTRRAQRLDNTLSVRDHERLEAFFQDPAGFVKGLSLMQAPIGGELAGMFEAMKDDFNVDLKAFQDEMAKEQSTYDELMASKKEEIKASEATKESKRQQRVEKRQSVMEMGPWAVDNSLAPLLRQFDHYITSTATAIGTSGDFLKLVEEKCGATDEEWTERTATRKEEIASVAKAIEVLTTEAAKTSFGKTYTNFLQKEVADERFRRASQALERAAAVRGDRRLSQLAKAAGVKGMEKVLKAIDGMKVALKKEQQDEVEQRDFCIKSFNENKVKTEKMKDLKGQHNAKLDMLADKLKTTAAAVSVAKGKIDAANKELEKAAKDHEDEVADFKTTLSDQNTTKVMLNEALDSLKAFYVEKPKAKKSLLQKPSEDTVPEGFKDYQKSSSGNAVTQLLQQVILDTKAMEAETTRAMKSSEKQFAKLTDATNADIAALNGELESLAKAKASAQEAVVAEKANLKGTKKELADLALDEAEGWRHSFGIRPTIEFALSRNAQAWNLRAGFRASKAQSLKLQHNFNP
ncbi:unnamed protein product [Symbiodinium sp. KB8]|nr:unnamed protein product [Symbiodinium sp. KB8]